MARPIAPSTRPPVKPAMMPSTVPIITVISAADSAMVSEQRGAQHQPGHHVAARLRLDAQRVIEADAAGRALREVAGRVVQQLRVERVGVEHPDLDEDRREDGHQHEEHGDRERDHGEPVLAEPGPGQLEG